VRQRAPRKLKGSNIWVNKQSSPPNRRKETKVIPSFQKKRKAKLVVDKLYIDGELYVPPEIQHSTDRDSTPTAGVVE
jgi:hypothetical protein